MHPKLLGNPIGYSKLGVLAMRRSGHSSPAEAALHESGVRSSAEVLWDASGESTLEVLDPNRVTEDGAEAVALVYVSAPWLCRETAMPSG